VLDAEEFIEWLSSVDVVESVGFVAKLPNPEPMAAFDDLAGCLKRAHGTEYSARMTSKREEGLQQIASDPEFKQATAMGEQGFAQLRGRGRREGHGTTYSQTNKVAFEPITRLPEDWEETRELLKNILRTRLRRFVRGDDQAA
jgi:hypothetical protein